MLNADALHLHVGSGSLDVAAGDATAAARSDPLSERVNLGVATHAR